MCMAKLYEAKKRDGLLLEDVARITIKKDGYVEVETLFGEKSLFRGKVRSVDFVKSQVQLERE